jgi:hypothetical protein
MKNSHLSSQNLWINIISTLPDKKFNLSEFLLDSQSRIEIIGGAHITESDALILMEIEAKRLTATDEQLKFIKYKNVELFHGLSDDDKQFMVSLHNDEDNKSRTTCMFDRVRFIRK